MYVYLYIKKEDNTLLKHPCRGRSGFSGGNCCSKQSSHSQRPSQPSGSPLHKHILESIKWKYWWYFFIFNKLTFYSFIIYEKLWAGIRRPLTSNEKETINRIICYQLKQENWSSAFHVWKTLNTESHQEFLMFSVT